jgi:hypothetical protein
MSACFHPNTSTNIRSINFIRESCSETEFCDEEFSSARMELKIRNESSTVTRPSPYPGAFQKRWARLFYSIKRYCHGATLLLIPVGGQRRKAPCPRLPLIKPRGLRCAQPTLHIVTTRPDPVVHAGVPAAWIAGSSPAMTSSRPSCPALCRASTSFLPIGRRGWPGQARP